MRQVSRMAGAALTSDFGGRKSHAMLSEHLRRPTTRVQVVLNVFQGSWTLNQNSSRGCGAQADKVATEAHASRIVTIDGEQRRKRLERLGERLQSVNHLFMESKEIRWRLDDIEVAYQARGSLVCQGELSGEKFHLTVVVAR